MASVPRLTALLGTGDLRTRLSRGADLVLAALVVSIVGMMIVPLPAWLLDLLISLNIGIAVTLLLIALYVSDALKIATFPTLLLLTTLFRLALEVSATRLILLKANAGDVIAAFGNFVVAGNLVVGAVIFLILTLIQFIVISKGAERVAEVAARFTLDAMPGKQMAIDAELRAGHIDQDEARHRRTTLARESQLFGSMDGAMKFVKGDAIAGIVVLVVNIVGGLIVGMLQRGMDAATAVRTYTVLTIGGGLVAQIPALVISTAAGIIVTRVASEEGDGAHLGHDIGTQILAHPKALAIAGALLGLLALVPGLPALPFVALAAVLGLVAWRLPRSPTSGARGPNPPAGHASAAAAAPLALVTPVTVDVSPALANLLGPADTGMFATQEIAALRARLHASSGLPLPPVALRVDAVGLAGGAYVLRLNEIPTGRGEIPLVRDSRLATNDPGPGRLIADHLAQLLARHGHEFIGIQETQVLLKSLELTHPALIREVVPKLVSAAVLAEILRRLAQEGISLRHLREVLESLAAGAGTERDPAVLTERVRAGLRRALTFQVTDSQGMVAAFTLDPLIEDTVREAVTKTATGTHLALEPRLARDVVAAVGRALKSAEGAAAKPIVLTTAEIRRPLRQLLETDYPGLPVLSYAELLPEARIRDLGRINV